MSLEALNQKLFELAEELQQNNSRHYRLNESILELSSQEAIKSKDEPPNVSKGLLDDLENVVSYLDYLISRQINNIIRTESIIKEPRTETVVSANY